MRTKAFVWTGAAALALLAAEPLRADEVLRWNEVATDVAARARTDPFTESRALAILHLAVHDAVNAVGPRYASYGPALSTSKGASAEAAAAQAAHDTLVELFPTARGVFDAQLAEALSSIEDGAARSAGVDAG